ncbi:hypothetical protein [Nitrosomonas sp.]|uniref:hypothetical protein n=1 Tax=Nitrosomonas sp. TaxID=42353 RepID=UPI001D83E4E7|nr:hypothetical protein [Nitrosomonas sp.]MBX3617703.1 hypothetical protein [Nitrosomonas sp.]
MKKYLVSIVSAASLVLSGMQPVLAEPVAVQGSSIFIVDNSIAGSQIIVRNLIDGKLDACLANAGLNQLALSDHTIATDILIKNGTAIITTYNDTSLVTDVKLVDVTNCPIVNTIDLSECYAVVEDDRLTIPCLKYGASVISVIMKQRGHSMNYEFDSYTPKKDRKYDD